MATWTITPKKGTTQEWEESNRILNVNEWGVEETVKGTYILRIGDGRHEFMELPVVVDFGAMVELANTVQNFSGNMQKAASDAGTAAEEAKSATTQAQAAAQACQNLEAGINSMSDAATGKVYTIGVYAGKIYLQEVES